jgi:hypothetical protein
MPIVWETPAGNLGTITERVILDIPIQASSPEGPVTFSLLSGRLPRGLRLSTDVSLDSSTTTTFIKGSPTEVKKFTTNRFVIRASDGKDIEDRTFSISVDGADAPQWITNEGFLNVGPNNAFYVLDNSLVDFQLEVRDPDIIAGDQLEFFLIPNGGELPPGLTLSRSGRITGFTDPIFALEYDETRTGAYDTGTFDTMPLDLANQDQTGYDSYIFDRENFDFSETTRAPRRLSRFYTFIVGVSDGVYEIRRLFRIWVVTEEFLQSDNTIIQVDSNLFQADGDGSRRPLWITESNLGRFRANNYVTIFLDVYDPPSLAGSISYFLVDTNPGTYRFRNTEEIINTGRYEITGDLPEFKYVERGDWRADLNYVAGDAVRYDNRIWVCQEPSRNVIPTDSIYWDRNIFINSGTFLLRDNGQWEVLEPETQSEIPPGMSLDNTTGEIAGRVPYQAAITKSYKFTMLAINFPPVLFEQNYTIKGDWSSTTNYRTGDAVRYDNFIWVALQDSRNQEPRDGEFWDRGVSTAEKTFNVDVIGEIESAIIWETDEDLGTIEPNLPSDITVSAVTTFYGSRIIYELDSGVLPPGLELISNGLIQGKVKQFADSKGPGLTRFYDKLDSSIDESTSSRSYSLSFDGDSTSFDRLFTFHIKARDAINVAENIKTFRLFVNTTNNLTFANLYCKAFQIKSKRLDWYNFITDSEVFREDEIYRYGDPNFGIQSELRMLLFAGIESKEAQYFVQAMSRNHYRKQVRFGEVKTAVAKDPTSQAVVYEVVYAEIVDEFEKNGKSISAVIELPNNINSRVLTSYDAIRVDSDIPLVSDRDHQRIFPNSYKNMRSRIRNVGERDRKFLPLWMRSIQPGTFVETGYVKSVVFAYTKPGFSEKILNRIRNKNFDLKSLDFTIDRYLIDVIDGEFENKYLAFPQRGEKLP